MFCWYVRTGLDIWSGFLASYETFVAPLTPTCFLCLFSLADDILKLTILSDADASLAIND